MINNKRCPNCESVNIKKIDSPENFLSHKPEGESAQTNKPKDKQKYYCFYCEHEWEEDIKYE